VENEPSVGLNLQVKPQKGSTFSTSAKLMIACKKILGRVIRESRATNNSLVAAALLLMRWLLASCAQLHFGTRQ